MTEPALLLPVVIGNPDRGLAPALETGWLANAGAVVLPAVLMRRNSDAWRERVDEAAFVARFGRPPMEGEMGCAAAHLTAYDALLASECTWALVLEDDARVLDVDELAVIVEVVTKHVAPTGRVISLYTEGPVFPAGQTTTASVTMMDLRLPPHGAVAYLVDRIAAADLCSAQSRLGSVSDWPPTARQVQYAYVPNHAIGHATHDTASTVSREVDRRTAVPVTVRLMMWTGLWYLVQRRHFDGVADYARQISRPRIARRLWLRG